MDNELDKYIEQMVIEGYITEDGKPLKCHCGCTAFNEDDEYYDEHGRVEYQVYCKDCCNKLGHWAYGRWEI